MRQNGIRPWLVLALALPCAGPALAQEIDFGGQVRPRFEFRGLDGFDLDTDITFTSMRTRLWARAALRDDIHAFVQLQDVRLWGEESGTTDGAANMLDLHQGWVELGDPAAARALRIGRQELAYGEERLIGPLDWVQQARAFDGARLRIRRSDVVVDGFGMRLAEDEAQPAGASLFGLYGTLPAAGTVDLYGFYNTLGEVTDQATLGGRWASARDAISWRIEAAYQLGTRADQDVSAYLLALKAGTPVGERAAVELWYDRLSGDDDPADGEIKVFDTLFATNHKFYGYMDLFTDIPAQTGGRGLQDLALKGTYALRDDVELGADLHAFFVAAGDGLESSHLGEELDLTGRWAYAPGLGLSGGFSVFLPGDAWPTDDTMTWLFVMMDLVF